MDPASIYLETADTANNISPAEMFSKRLHHNPVPSTVSFLVGDGSPIPVSDHSVFNLPVCNAKLFLIVLRQHGSLFLIL